MWVLSHYIGGDYSFASDIVLLVEMPCSIRVVMAPEHQGAPRGVRAVPKPFPIGFPEDSLRDGGLDRQQNIGSPVDMLVNTVS